MGRQSKHAPGAAKLSTARGTPNHDGHLCSSGKICFDNADAARGAALASRALSHVDIAIYVCDECGFHHHTKKTTGKSNPLPPMRSRVVTADRLTRLVRMLHDADALAIDALFAYPSGDAPVALEACKLACAEGQAVKLELEHEGITRPGRGSLAREFLDVLERVETKRRALTRLVHQ